MLKKISVDDLKPGMVVLKCDKDWLRLAFFGRSIENLDIIKILKNYGVTYVYIESDNEIAEENSLKNDPEGDLFVNSNDTKKYSATIENVSYIQRIYKTTLEIVSDIMNDLRNGGEIFYEDVSMVVEQFLEECFKRPNLVASVARIKNIEDYELSHAMNVSVLNMALARRMGMDIEEMKLIGIGGLLHDIGKVKIPKTILDKPGKLTEEEFNIVKMHPKYGADMLKNRFPKMVTECVLFHHEKANGTGYPFNLKDMQIPKCAKITSVSDVYDALTSDKVYRDGSSAPKAISEMLHSAGLQFNNILIKLFVEIMGGYPSGTLVLLDTGELAVVFKENNKDPKFPLVVVITDKNQKNINPYLFDLSEYNLLTKKPYKTILAPLDNKKYNVDPNRVIDMFTNSTSMEERYG
ncbi:MAG: HD-GYP domain-containing protein [Calditerrivibrio sp.]|nr:HD-GYP domain-containing protein [Calditerrivibrio sp.]